jgi:RNA polymerase sigma-70 factor (sigma-E family)
MAELHLTAPTTTVVDRGAALAAIHAEHYRPLVRLAALMVGDVGAAEEVVQDAFVNVFRSFDRVRAGDKLVSYLRSAVLNGARNRLARRPVVERLRRERVVDAPAADIDVLGGDRRAAMLRAVRSLPARQCDCLLLRFYLDLSESEIAAALGISNGSVKTHTSRGLRALASQLENNDA